MLCLEALCQLGTSRDSLTRCSGLEPWRKRNSRIQPDLHGANLGEADRAMQTSPAPPYPGEPLPGKPRWSDSPANEPYRRDAAESLSQGPNPIRYYVRDFDFGSLYMGS